MSAYDVDEVRRELEEEFPFVEWEVKYKLPHYWPEDEEVPLERKKLEVGGTLNGCQITMDEVNGYHFEDGVLVNGEPGRVLASDEDGQLITTRTVRAVVRTPFKGQWTFGESLQDRHSGANLDHTKRCECS
jgi:hypothetical protein